MKKLLLATSALVGLAGAAAAEVSVTGDGRIGLRYDSGLDTVGFDDNERWNVVSRARVRFTMTGETDSGLSFGATLRADQAENAGVGSNASNTEGIVWISGAYGRLTAGDIDSALEHAVGDLPEIGVSGLNFYNEFQYTTSEFDTETDFGNAGLLYDYQIGDATLYASFMDRYVGTTGERIEGDAWALGAGYTLGNYTFGIGYESANIYVDPVLYTALSQNFTAAAFDADNETWGISGGTSFAGITFKAIYLSTNVDDDGVDFDSRQYGIGAEYAMANGVELAGFWRRVKGDDIGGVDHEADIWGLGAGYDLGGGAELKGGIAFLDGSSGIAVPGSLAIGDFDRTVADFGLRLNF